MNNNNIKSGDIKGNLYRQQHLYRPSCSHVSVACRAWWWWTGDDDDEFGVGVEYGNK